MLACFGVSSRTGTMLAESHQRLADKIWAVANKLRGPYRPPQYRKVMLPLIVLRRLDCVLEPTKDVVLKQVETLKAKKLSGEAIEKALAKVASKDRKQPLFNVSRFTFAKLLGDPSGIAKNLTAYIKGFSPKVREIFERFEFELEIEKLDENNMLFEIIKEFSTIDLHPDKVSNLEMGYLFEYLIRKFNEQANEEAGDHFTPREVIRLMADILCTGDEDIHIPGSLAGSPIRVYSAVFFCPQPIPRAIKFQHVVTRPVANPVESFEGE
jgi:type I restriction enzyme M protein